MKYLPEALSYLEKADKRFKLIIKELPELVFNDPLEPYVDLISSVASQQLSTKAARVIWGRFLALFEDKYPHPAIVKELDVEILRSLGFSYAKSQYVKNIASFFDEHKYDGPELGQMSDEELLKTLISIKGVGEWTVQMLQIFNLHRSDIWPTKDLGVQQSFAKMHNLDPLIKGFPKQMEEMAEGWRPYRSAAALLLWKWKDVGYPNLTGVLSLNVEG